MGFDRFFKVGLLILGTAFLVLYFLNSRANRYQYFEHGFRILDTRNRVIYKSNHLTSWVRVDPVFSEFTDDLGLSEKQWTVVSQQPSAGATAAIPAPTTGRRHPSA